MGGGWDSTDWQHNHLNTCPGNAAFNVASCDISQNANSFIGGGQIGARWQTGHFVLGIEGTADYARFNAVDRDPAGAAALAAGLTVFNLVDTTRLRNLYTVTGQAGYAWNRQLVYVKGGWAGSSLWRDMLETSTVNGTFFDGQVSQQVNGWTVGVGFEYRLMSMPNFSVGVEYDYMRLTAGNATACATGTALNIFACPAPAQPLLFNGFHADVNQVLLRGNYTFNWSGPVVAKY